MKANNNEVVETAKDKFLKKVEDTLKTYCIESFMDDVIGDDIGDIYADIECLMDDAKESNNKDALADLTKNCSVQKEATVMRYVVLTNKINL